MSYLVFFPGDDKLGRDYEWWQACGAELDDNGMPLAHDDCGDWVPVPSPYAVGDVLWVREAHAIVPATAYWHDETIPHAEHGDEWAVYRASWVRSGPGHWRPSIHMPRWASRLSLRVTDVRVQRLQDITPEDAKAEGDHERSGMPEYHRRGSLCHIDWFRGIWDDLNAKRGLGWVANPWVWAYTFEVIP